MITVTVEQMDDFFLYLPLHLALSKNCFGFLPNGYRLNLRSSYPPTDRQAFNRLMDPGTGVWFAVCDPTEVLRYDNFPDVTPALLATIVTNAAFWAVNRGTQEIRLFRDLAVYREIISYDEGTTSYGIAHRIKTLPNRTHDANLRQVHVGDELTRLKESEVGTVAITPNVLGLEELLAGEHQGFAIDLELSKTPEYHDVLVSALISRADIVSRHRGLVIGLLKALQAAMLHCRMESDFVLDYVRQRYDPRFSIAALRRAIINDLFPASVEIKADEWHQATRARVAGIPREYLDQDEATAEDLFARFAQPYTQLVRDEVHRSVLRGPVPEYQQRPPYREVGFSILLVMILTALTKLFLPPTQRWPYGLAAFVCVLALGRTVEWLIPFGSRRSVTLTFRVLGALLAGGAAAVAVLPFSAGSLIYGLTFAILGAIAAVVIAVVVSRRDGT